MNDVSPPSNDELRARIERAVSQSPLGEVFADPAARRRKLFELMAATDDPMTKELGKDLLTGRVSLRDVVTSSAYEGYLDRGLEKLQETSLADLADQLEEYQDAEADKSAQRDDDDDEDYSDGPIVFRGPRDRR